MQAQESADIVAVAKGSGNSIIQDKRFHLSEPVLTGIGIINRHTVKSIKQGLVPFPGLYW